MREERKEKEMEETRIYMSEEEKAAWTQGALDRLTNDAIAWKAYKHCKEMMDKNSCARAYVDGFENSGTGD